MIKKPDRITLDQHPTDFITQGAFGSAKVTHMKLLLTLVVLAVIAASFYADFQWRRWIARRKQDENSHPHSDN